MRSLASRSADAAKEIKTLINASVERVEQGTTQVDQAGVTMNEVVSSIRRVTDIMGEISAASQEQTAGVAQVGEAVTSIDEATQQNAALVEEMAAAAASLRTQAHDLVQSVSVFRLSAHEPSGERVALRAPAEARQVAAPRPAIRAQGKASPPIARLKQATSSTQAPAPAIAAAKAPARPAAKPGRDDDWETFE